jgi:hypothetical protein
MTHPLIDQLRFTRREFQRSLAGLSEADAGRRLMPMNCISWNVGHLAWQEQKYFLYYAQGQLPYPEIHTKFAYGAPASTPPLSEMFEAWLAITTAADPWLESRQSDDLLAPVIQRGKPNSFIYGSLILRVIYHYWYHIGENMSIRQSLGQSGLPEFVGDIDEEAPYRPERGI